MTTETARAAIVAEALTWLRTPYHKHGRVKGAGVDCSMLLAEVYEATGTIPHIAPTYAADWHLHHSRELYLEWLQQFGDEIPGPPLPGDVAVWRFGRTYSHGAIVIDWPQIIHAYRNRPVELADAEADEQLRTRLVKFYRLRGVDDGR